MKAHHTPVQRNILAGHADVAATDLAVADQPARNKLGSVHSYRKADSLRRQNDCSIDADHLAEGVHQRPTRVAGI
jgi:hypothetical protein